MKLFTRFFLFNILISLFFWGCSSKDDDVNKLMQENEKLKQEMAEKDKLQQEEEKQKLQSELASLRNEILQKEGNENEDNRLKNINIRIVVDNLKNNGHEWDMGDGPDIGGYIVIGNQKILIDSDENSFEATALVSNVKLMAGDIIKINLYDLDIIAHDKICNDDVVYNGNRIFLKRLGNAEISFEII
ncbi:MAG: hypothetical protein ACM3O3_08790 [Syntrophothermus sp.]